MLARDARAVIGRGGRRVAERLRERGRDRRQRGQHVLRRHVVLERRRAEVARGDPRVLHLVVALGIEAHADGGDAGPQCRPRCRRRWNCRDRRSGRRRPVRARSSSRPTARRSSSCNCRLASASLIWANRRTSAPNSAHAAGLAVPMQAMAALELGQRPRRRWPVPAACGSRGTETVPPAGWPGRGLRDSRAAADGSPR